MISAGRGKHLFFIQGFIKIVSVCASYVISSQIIADILLRLKGYYSFSRIYDLFVFVIFSCTVLYIETKNTGLPTKPNKVKVARKDFLLESLIYSTIAGICVAINTQDILFAIIISVTMTLLLLPALRIVPYLADRMVELTEDHPERVLIVGSGAVVTKLKNELDTLRRRPFVFIMDDVLITDLKCELPDCKFIEGLHKVEEVLSREIVDHVYICLPVRSYYNRIITVLNACLNQGIPVSVRPLYTLPDYASARHSSEAAFPEEIRTGSPLLDSFAHRMLKRIVDLVGAALLIALTSPLMIFAAVAIRLSSPGPVLFRQIRLGRNKRPFTIYKFRTMYVDAEKRLKELESLSETGGAAFKLKDDPRVTKVGKILRKTSIDELPQLFNVLKGEMSLVGPRPLPLTDYQRIVDYAHLRRMSVKPGITGLWQISGRSDLSFDEWIKLDMYYIDNWSLALDLKILLKTIKAVITGRGAV